MTAVPITSGGKDRIAAVASMLSPVFETDPVITYLLCTLSPSTRLSYLPNYFLALFTAAGMNNALFHEADNWKCCGVLVPPGCRVDNLWTMLPAGILGVLWNIGVGGCRRMLSEYGPLSDASKVKGLAGRKDYYYVFIIGTKQGEEGRGLCSSLMRTYQEIASREDMPIWLEATTEKSMKIYLKLGWKVVDEIVLGKGQVSSDGEKEAGGEGVKIWTMVWWPKMKEGEEESI